MLLSCVGNDDLHLLTSGKRQVLRVDLEDWEGNGRYAEYDNFVVGSEQENYKFISIGTYTGNAGENVKPMIYIHTFISIRHKAHSKLHVHGYTMKNKIK